MNKISNTCYSSHFDVTIIGAGLAGLQCARDLSAKGISVLLVDRKSDLTKGVHTTGIFVRKTFEDFEFLAGTLGRPIRNVELYSPKLRSMRLESDMDEFRIGRMGPLYESLLSECIASGVEFLPETRFVSIETGVSSSHVSVMAHHGARSPHVTSGSTVILEKNGSQFSVNTKVIVGADGANSAVARSLGLDQNREMIVGYEEVYHRKTTHSESVLHCFLDAELAPGYIAWVADDGVEIHIGVGGYSSGYKPREALETFKKKIASKFDPMELSFAESRGGRIPVGGILRRISNEVGLLIGDAAGAVSPLTAGGLDPCMRLSAYAADVITERIKTADPSVLSAYSGKAFRSRFISRLWMRRALSIARSQTLLELGCRFLRGKLGAKFAKHIFFGRGSFPDVHCLDGRRTTSSAWSKRGSGEVA